MREGIKSKIICLIFEFDFKDKERFIEEMTITGIYMSYPSIIGTNQKVKSFAIKPKFDFVCPKF